MTYTLRISLFASILSLLLVIVNVPATYTLFDKNLIIFLSVISICNIIIFFRTIRLYYKSWVRYDTIFLTGFLIVHFQIPFLAAIGIEPIQPEWWVWINKQIVNYATWFSCVILLLWMIGFYVFLWNKKTIKEPLSNNYKVNTVTLNNILVFVFSVFVVIVGKDFLSGSYSGTRNWGAGATYAFLILRVVIFLSVIYFFINYSGKLGSRLKIAKAIFENKVLFVISGLFVLIFLAAGDRGPVMQIALLYFGGYSIYQSRIAFRTLFLFICTGAVLFTIVKLGRTRDASDRDGNIIAAGYQSFNEGDEGFNPTDEFATSGRILYRALDVVPDKHPYLYGTTIASNIAGAIPFGSNVFLSLTGLPPMYANSSVFFTVLGHQGEFYTHGEGSEIIADIYINFGFVVTLIIFLFFGYFISFLTYQSFYHKDLRFTIVYMLLITSSLYINRSNFLNPLDIIVLVLIADRFIIKKTVI